MSLAARLDAIRTAFLEQADDETTRIMHEATKALEASGLADRAIGVGDAAPGFTLPRSDGGTIDLADVLARGPVVLTFFRGHW